MSALSKVKNSNNNTSGFPKIGVTQNHPFIGGFSLINQLQYWGSITYGPYGKPPQFNSFPSPGDVQFGDRRPMSQTGCFAQSLKPRSLRHWPRRWPARRPKDVFDHDEECLIYKYIHMVQ